MALSTGPTEKKVTAAGISSGVTSYVMAWLLLKFEFLGNVSAPVEALVLAAVTAVVTFSGAWLAKHTPRTDPDAVKAQVPGTGL